MGGSIRPTHQRELEPPEHLALECFRTDIGDDGWDVRSVPEAKPMRRSIARPGQPPRSRVARHALFCSKVQRRLARHDDLYFRARAGFGVQIDPAAQTIGHDVVDDVQSEASAALVAPGREKRVEYVALDLRAHAAAIV